MSAVAGFYKAPTTKILFWGTLASSLIAQSLRRASLFGLDVTRVVGAGQLYRLTTSHAVVATPAELLFMLYILYQFRTFERQMGSSKFVAFVTMTCAIATTLQISLLLSLSTLRRTSSGPYALIFALFVYYYAKVPKRKPQLFRFCGITASDKTLTYLLGLQLLFNDGWSSFIAGFSGMLVGIVYSSDLLGVSRFRFPRSIRDFSESYILPAFASAAPGAAEARRREQRAMMQQMQRRQMQQQMQQAAGNPTAMANLAALLQQHQQAAGAAGGGAAGGGGGGGAMLPPRPPADPAAVERLMGMGFSRERVEEALGVTGNNEEQAVNVLLSG